MNPLVTFEKGEARTTSLILAEGTQVQHKNVLGLVRTYLVDLEEFGLVAFETRPRLRGMHGGGDMEVAHLNEPQATLIMTYMKNTPIVREFKKQLVRAFFELRDMVNGTPDKRVDVNMRHTRGITNPHGLDIRYTFDLSKIATKPNRIGMQMVERLSGVDLSDLVEQLEKPLPRNADFAGRVAHCLALLMSAEDVSVWNLTRTDAYLEGFPGDFAKAFAAVAKANSIPAMPESAFSLGARMHDADLAVYGWKRIKTARVHGREKYRYERTPTNA